MAELGHEGNRRDGVIELINPGRKNGASVEFDLRVASVELRAMLVVGPG